MNAREQWKTLHALLTSARTSFEEGDREAALRAVRTALTLDPDFLAAQSLRDRILTPDAAEIPERPVAATETITATEESVRVQVPAPNRLNAPTDRPTAPASPAPLPRPLLAVFSKLEQEAELRRSQSREPVTVDDHQRTTAVTHESTPPLNRESPPALNREPTPALSRGRTPALNRERTPAANPELAPVQIPDLFSAPAHDHELVPVHDDTPVPARYYELDAALGHPIGPTGGSLIGTVEELWRDRDESRWHDLDEFRGGTKRDPDEGRLQRRRTPREAPRRRRLALLAAAVVFGAVVLDESWRQQAAWMASQSIVSIAALLDSPEARDSAPASVEPAPASVEPAPASVEPAPAPAEPAPASAEPSPASAEPSSAPSAPAPAPAESAPSPAQPAPAAKVNVPSTDTGGTSNSRPTPNAAGPTKAAAVQGAAQLKPPVSKANENASAELQRVRAIVAAEALADRRGEEVGQPVQPAATPSPGATPLLDAVVAAASDENGRPAGGTPSEPLARPAVAGDTLPAAPAPTAPASLDDQMMIQRVLQRYRSAYQVLDARSARDVFPAVNQAALSRAFEGLESQTLSFDECDVRVRGSAGGATCRGTASYVPKVGSREAHVESRTWTFVLRKIGADWVIQSVRTDR